MTETRLRLFALFLAVAWPGESTRAQQPIDRSDTQVRPNEPTSPSTRSATGTTNGINDAASRRALLIGCADYPHLPSKYSLRGPTNDVRLFAHVLRSRLGFSEQEITCLWQGEPAAQRPTRAAIEAAFERLIDQAHVAQDIVILLAGHGSQQATEDPQSGEADGMDEVFLPEDVREWRQGNAVSLAITDNQIHAWLTRLREKGAFVFFIADCCHSGTLARGPSEVATRHVPPELLWAPRPPLISRVVSPPLFARNETLVDSPSSSEMIKSRGRGGYVALYAVPANALEVEEKLPPDADTPKALVHGRLTYALCESLQRASEQLTYRELAQRIQRYYERWPWLPYHQIEGDALDRQVLGPQEWPGRSSLLMTRNDRGTAEVNAGLLHGLTRSSILSVHRHLDEKSPESVLGYVRVGDITPTSATVEPYAWNGKVALSITSFPEHTRCQVAHLEYGDLRLKVAVSSLSNRPDQPREGPPVEVVDRAARLAERVREVTESVDRICRRPDSLTRLVDPTHQPDVLVAITADQRVVVCQASDAHLQPVGAADWFGPYAIAPSLSSELDAALRRMARAIQLRRLADQFQEHPFSSERLISRLKIELLPYQLNARGQPGELGNPLPVAGPLTVHDDERIAVRVTNQSTLPIDITVLYVDSAFRIQSFFPTRKQAGLLDNRLHAKGESAVAYFHISDEVAGPEDVVVIATRAPPGSPPVHFAHLEQDGLPSAADIRGRAEGVSRLALERLFQRTLYGVGDVRGGDPREMSDFSMTRIRWTVARGKVVERSAIQRPAVTDGDRATIQENPSPTREK